MLGLCCLNADSAVNGINEAAFERFYQQRRDGEEN